MIECVCPTTLQYMQGNRGTTGQKHWYKHVPKSVETSQGGKVKVSDNTTHVEGKDKGDTSNTRSDWEHFKIIQKIHK